ncbi:hypothetical protein [Chitinimonas naiadis]
MKISSYPKMFFSYHAGWDDLSEATISVAQLTLFLVLPFALLPAAMIAFVAADHATYYSALVPAARYPGIALVFLLAELLTVPIMGLAIKAMLGNREKPLPFQRAYLMASIAPIPMWLSSLTLAVPHMGFNLLCGLLGLCAALLLVVHGIPKLLQVEEGIEAEDVGYAIISLGGLLWALLAGLILVPLLGL